MSYQDSDPGAVKFISMYERSHLRPQYNQRNQWRTFTLKWFSIFTEVCFSRAGQHCHCCHIWAVHLPGPEICSTVFCSCNMSDNELWKGFPLWNRSGILKMSTPFLELKCLCWAMMWNAWNSQSWLLEECLLFPISKAQLQTVLHSTGHPPALSGFGVAG